MIFPFDPVTLSTGYVLAGLSACPGAPSRVTVDVGVKHQPAPYVTTLTSQQLTAQFGADPDATTSTDGKWMVGGLNKSNLSASYKVHFYTHTNRKTGDACFAINKIDYDIVYQNTIYIASDYKNMGCRYSATLAHERRHVQIDLRTINDFMIPLKRKIEEHALAFGAMGPYQAHDVQTQQQHAIMRIDQTLKPLLQELVAVRRQRQATIDTEESYRRDTALCPGQFPKFDGSL